MQVLNKKFNQLKISEFTEKLYTPFKNKEEDMRNASKTAMLLVRTPKASIINPFNPKLIIQTLPKEND